MPLKTTPRLPGSNTIPAAVLNAYGIGPVQRTRLLGNGLVNITFLVTTADGQYVLQRLGASLGAVSLHTHRILGTALQAKGWEVPLPHRPRRASSADDDTFAYGQSRWRCLRYVASDDTPPVLLNTEFITAAAALLGAWHRDVAALAHCPATPRVELHDLDYQAKRLKKQITTLAGPAAEMAAALLDTYRHLAALPAAKQQIIHGDPKFDNMLFRSGLPFTFVDFDAVTRASPWTDVGDMLRSLAGKRLLGGTPFTASDYRRFAQAYQTAARLTHLSSEAVHRYALEAGKHIAAEVGMRYLNDLGNGGYLNWDKQAYPSKYAHHVSKARLQLAVVEQIEHILGQHSFALSA